MSVAFQTSKSKQQREQALQVKIFEGAQRKSARFSGGRTRWRAWNSCSCLARPPVLLFYQLLTQIQLPLVRFCFQLPNPKVTGALFFMCHFFSRWSAGWMWSSWVSMWRSSVTATYLLLVILIMLMSNTNGIKILLSGWAEDIYYDSNQYSGAFPTSGSATGTRIVSVGKTRATVFAMCQGDQVVKYENRQEPINYWLYLAIIKRLSSSS